MKKFFEENKNILIIVAVIFAVLIVLNLLIIFGAFDNRLCVQVEKYNVYVCGEHNPVEEVNALVKGSYHIDVVFESDAEPTQKGSYIAQGVASLAEQLAGHDTLFYGIEFRNGAPVTCKNDGNLTLEQCLNFVPSQDSALIYIKYPEGGSRSEIEVIGRTIYFKTHTAVYLKNLVDFVFAYLIN